MSIYSLLSLIDSSFCAIVASLFLWRGRRQTWVLTSLFYILAAWVSLPWLFLTALPHASYSFMVNSYAVAVAVPTFLLLVALMTMEEPLFSLSLIICAGLGIFFLCFLRSPLFFRGLHMTERGLFPTPGPLFGLFSIYFSTAAASMLIAVWWMYRKTDESRKKNRLKWVGLAFLSANLGGVMHLLASVYGYDLIPHDLFIIAFVSLVGYAVLRRTLYDVELLTHDAAIRVGTLLLLMMPLLLGRLVASRLPGADWLMQVHLIFLLCAMVFFFGIGIQLLQYPGNAAALLLARLFVLWGSCNAASLIWFAPYNPYSPFVARLTFALACWLLVAWGDYRSVYVQQRSRPIAGLGLYRLWRYSAFSMMVFTILTPWVIRGLSTSTLVKLETIPGPALRFFEIWWLASLIGLCLWMARPVWNAVASAKIRWTLVASLGTALLAAFAYRTSLVGALQFPSFLILEMICGSFLLMTFVEQPHAGPHPPIRAAGRMVLALGIPCAAGLSLKGAWWIETAGAMGLMLGMRRVWTDVETAARAWVDGVLFREKYSYLADIKQIADDIFRFTNIPDLMKHLVNDLSARARLEWVGIWLFDLTEGRYVLRQASDPKENSKFKRDPYLKAPFMAEDPLLKRLYTENSIVIVDELAAARELAPGNIQAELDILAADQLRNLHLAAAFPVFIEKKLIGFIGFGHKDDDAMIHQADQTGLTELGEKAERAIGQAYMLYEQSMMLSRLAHDTLNSLHALGMVLSILDNQMIGPINEMQKHQLAIAISQRQMIEDCLTDLRELERLVMLRMQGTWQMEPYDLTIVVNEAVQAFQNRANQKGVELTGQWKSVPRALGDQRAVRRVIDNLIVNALKFTPSGGRVYVSVVEDHGQNLRLAVVDTGPGIPPEELPRVFDPFYSGPTGLKIAQGTGLGLSVVKEVTALHRGNVHVESIVGKGTTFVVELPTIARQAEFHKKEGGDNG